jgi:hypothetical protein
MIVVGRKRRGRGRGGKREREGKRGSRGEPGSRGGDPRGEETGDGSTRMELLEACEEVFRWETRGGD